jgi:ubiquitin carboxyl-terminal hydrolase 5/13
MNPEFTPMQDGPAGIDVCLVCFNGSCLDPDRHHTRTHVLRSGHSFTLNVKRTPKKKQSNRVSSNALMFTVH